MAPGFRVVLAAVLVVPRANALQTQTLAASLANANHGEAANANHAAHRHLVKATLKHKFLKRSARAAATVSSEAAAPSLYAPIF